MPKPHATGVGRSPKRVASSASAVDYHLNGAYGIDILRSATIEEFIPDRVVAVVGDLDGTYRHRA